MRSAQLFCLLLITMSITNFADAQGNSKPVDLLGVKGPVSFDNTSYNLAWASHPSPAYYKQEYLPKGENLDKFKSMVMIEAATGTIKLKDAVESKMAELKALGATNPFINFEHFYNADKDEYILDFIITQNSADNKSIIIAERNVYRYKNLPANKGIMLFAISNRSYNADAKNFIAKVKSDRKSLVDKVKSYTLPVLTLK